VAKKKAVKRERTQAQIDAELRREENASKTLVRHNKESSAALAKLRRQFDASDPEILRIALVELASKTRRTR
jgi:hypothetical protein